MFSFIKSKEELLFALWDSFQLPEVEVVMERPMALWIEGAMVEEWAIIADDSQRSTYLSSLQGLP